MRHGSLAACGRPEETYACLLFRLASTGHLETGGGGTPEEADPDRLKAAEPMRVRVSERASERAAYEARKFSRVYRVARALSRES